MTAYYNEFEPYAAQWLRNLIAAKLIPQGDVDERSIVDVQPGDLAGYHQCHFFAGIGGWALAARLAGWPDDRELWTGSCQCQPFSVAGKQLGAEDDRHLWPHYLRLVGVRRPMVVMGEQVAAAIGKDWLDGVRTDLHGEGYACRAIVLPACAVDAPHRRNRIWFVADRDGAVDQGVGARLEGHARDERAALGRAVEDRPVAATGCGGDVADADDSERRAGLAGRHEPDRQAAERHEGYCHVAERGAGFVADTDFAGACEGREQRGGELGGAGGDPVARAGRYVADANGAGCEPRRRDDQTDGYGDTTAPASDAGRNGRSAWTDASWIIGHDGKARRVEPGIRLLAHGVPARVGRLRAYGNAIVPQVAAEVIAAYMDCAPNV